MSGQPDQNLRPFDPDWVICPGGHVLDFIAEGALRMAPGDLMNHLQWDAVSWRRFLCGAEPLDDERADRLGRLMGLSTGDVDGRGSFWRNFERIYQEGLARGKAHTCHPLVTAAVAAEMRASRRVPTGAESDGETCETERP